TIIAVPHAVESAREIVDRAPAAGLLADDAVDVDPDQLAFTVIILAALPAAPSLRGSLGNDRVVRRVDQRPPGSARRSRTISRRRCRDRIERVLLRQHARAGPEDVTPELRLPLVNPQ